MTGEGPLLPWSWVALEYLAFASIWLGIWMGKHPDRPVSRPFIVAWAGCLRAVRWAFAKIGVGR